MFCFDGNTSLRYCVISNKMQDSAVNFGQTYWEIFIVGRGLRLDVVYQLRVQANNNRMRGVISQSVLQISFQTRQSLLILVMM